ncbi:hypothetical protein HGRIS_000471 [Hohenbuehelia grisea]|uniref:Uncharacterized protein n=1 Tax=Hohenbuehelia grisea TaxID=104357 RepID=A0ABR3JRX9_9AGAR
MSTVIRRNRNQASAHAVSEENAITKADKKWGLNLLGKALVKAREELRKEEEMAKARYYDRISGG